MNIKEMVKNNTVHFNYFKDGEFWYELEYDGGKKFIFPVPLGDIGNASMNRDDNALYFMRYIRKHLKAIEEDAKNMVDSGAESVQINNIRFEVHELDLQTYKNKWLTVNPNRYIVNHEVEKYLTLFENLVSGFQVEMPMMK